MNRKEYEERIAKLEKELDESKEVKIEDDEFPKYGQAYWFVEADGYVVGTQWCGSGVDSYRKTFLRIFRTDEECERYLEIQKHLKRNLKNLNQIGKMAINLNIAFITTMTKIVLGLVGVCGVGKQFYILKVEKY